jgi:hypothetical protein
MTKNFINISQSQHFTQFREKFASTPGVNINRDGLDEMITATYECMNESF